MEGVTTRSRAKKRAEVEKEDREKSTVKRQRVFLIASAIGSFVNAGLDVTQDLLAHAVKDPEAIDRAKVKQNFAATRSKTSNIIFSDYTPVQNATDNFPMYHSWVERSSVKKTPNFILQWTFSDYVNAAKPEITLKEDVEMKEETNEDVQMDDQMSVDDVPDLDPVPYIFEGQNSSNLDPEEIFETALEIRKQGVPKAKHTELVVKELRLSETISIDSLPDFKNNPTEEQVQELKVEVQKHEESALQLSEVKFEKQQEIEEEIEELEEDLDDLNSLVENLFVQDDRAVEESESELKNEGYSLPAPIGETRSYLKELVEKAAAKLASFREKQYEKYLAAFTDVIFSDQEAFKSLIEDQIKAGIDSGSIYQYRPVLEQYELDLTNDVDYWQKYLNALTQTNTRHFILQNERARLNIFLKTKILVEKNQILANDLGQEYQTPFIVEYKLLKLEDLERLYESTQLDHVHLSKLHLQFRNNLRKKVSEMMKELQFRLRKEDLRRQELKVDYRETADLKRASETFSRWLAEMKKEELDSIALLETELQLQKREEELQKLARYVDDGTFNGKIAFLPRETRTLQEKEKRLTAISTVSSELVQLASNKIEQKIFSVRNELKTLYGVEFPRIKLNFDPIPPVSLSLEDVEYRVEVLTKEQKKLEEGRIEREKARKAWEQFNKRKIAEVTDQLNLALDVALQNQVLITKFEPSYGFDIAKYQLAFRSVITYGEKKKVLEEFTQAADSFWKRYIDESKQLANDKDTLLKEAIFLRVEEREELETEFESAESREAKNNVLQKYKDIQTSRTVSKAPDPAVLRQAAVNIYFTAVLKQLGEQISANIERERERILEENERLEREAEKEAARVAQAEKEAQREREEARARLMEEIRIRRLEAEEAEKKRRVLVLKMEEEAFRNFYVDPAHINRKVFKEAEMVQNMPPISKERVKVTKENRYYLRAQRNRCIWYMYQEREVLSKLLVLNSWLIQQLTIEPVVDRFLSYSYPYIYKRMQVNVEEFKRSTLSIPPIV